MLEAKVEDFTPIYTIMEVKQDFCNEPQAPGAIGFFFRDRSNLFILLLGEVQSINLRSVIRARSRRQCG